MRFYLLSLLLLSLSAALQAQEDSLKAEQLLVEAQDLLFEAKYTEARRKCMEASEVFKKLGLRSKALKATHQAICARPIRQAKESIKELEQFREAAEPDSELWIRTGLAIAKTYETLGDNNQALLIAKEHLEKAENRGFLSQLELQDYYLFLANLYFSRKEYHQAELYLLQSERFLKEQKHHVPKALIALGSLKAMLLLRAKGDAKASVALLQEILELAQQHYGKNSLEVARVYQDMASYHYMLMAMSFVKGTKKGEAVLEAIRYTEQAIEIYKQELGSKNLRLANAYLNLGAFYKDYRPKGYWKDPSVKAPIYWEKSIAASLKGAEIYESLFYGMHPSLSVAYRNVASIYFMNLNPRQLDKGLEYLNKALKAVLPNVQFDDSGQTPLLNKVEDYVALDNEVALRALWLRANYFITAFRKTKDLNLLYKGNEQLDASIQFLMHIEKGIINQDDFQWLLASYHRVYSYYMQIHKILYKKTKEEIHLEKIFEYSEKAKSANLLRTLSATEGVLGGLPIDLQEKEQALKAKVSELQALLNDANEKQEAEDVLIELQNQLLGALRIYDDFIQSLEADYPNYHQVKYKRQSARLKDVQEKLLNDSTAILEFHQMSNWQNYFVELLVTKDSLHYLEGKKAKQTNKQVLTFIEEVLDFQQLQDNPEATYLKYWKRSNVIYTKLLKLDKFLDQRPQIKRLIIIPDQQLNYLPFEILVKQKPQGADTISKNYQELDYLLKSHAISYAYSATVLLEQQKRAKAKKKGGILGFAASYQGTADTAAFRAPDLNKLRAALNDLPGAMAEVASLKEQYAGQYFLGEQAHEAQFKKMELSKFSVLHLAMHGMLNSKNPMRSSLVFTENKSEMEDNFLYAYEIAQMDLPFDLVVLSACQTAAGAINSGEGVVSIARAFAYAGTPSILMTLWEVNDYSTNRIMHDFYQNLEAGMPRYEALRQAKLNYLENAEDIAQHPFFWAPFILSGDADPLSIQPKPNYTSYYIIAGALLLMMILLFFFRRRRQGS